MHLLKLSLLNYKNYEEVNLDFNPRINLFLGKNGSGKTNLLDSIYFLSLTKSAVSTTDNQNVRHGESFFMIKGLFIKDNRQIEIVSSFQSGSKKIFLENGTEYEKLSDHIGKFPIVLIAPDDSDLIKEGSEYRRKFFDGIIAQFDKQYLDSLLRYNHALKNRNSLLKMFYESGKADFLALDSYDNLLNDYGSYLYKKRLAFINEFNPIFQSFYAFLVEAGESPSIEYLSDLHESDYPQGLKANRQKDLLLQRSSFGTHRDDYRFLLDGEEIKRLGSQGQQKSFVISLKLAQYQVLQKYKGYKPILLLDDIFDKLDDERIKKILDLIKSESGQLFVTDARPHRTTELLRQIDVPATSFLVNKGKITGIN